MALTTYIVVRTFVLCTPFFKYTGLSTNVVWSCYEKSWYELRRKRHLYTQRTWSSNLFSKIHCHMKHVH